MWLALGICVHGTTKELKQNFKDNSKTKNSNNNNNLYI